MSGQHRADRFGSMNLEDEQRIRHGAPPLRHPPEQLEPFPYSPAVPGGALLDAPGTAAPAALELAHDERGRLERGDQAEQLEEVWPADPLDRWETAQLEHVGATFDLLRRMIL